MITGREISKVYPATTALDRVSFSIGDGQIVGVIGHNGAGKTTLLKILAGLIEPSSGQLLADGLDVTRHPRRMKEVTGYLPEESRLYESMKVNDYLTFFGEIYGLSRPAIRDRSRDLLASLSLDPDGKKIGELSKGMKRKVAIARSLLHDPSLLIYDEATSGLDPMTSRSVADYLRELRNAGKTIVLSAHNLYQVEAICDRVLILQRGQLVADGTMPELRERFGSIGYSILFTLPGTETPEDFPPFTMVGAFFRVQASGIDEMNRVSRQIVEAGGAVERIESHHPSLEDILVKIGK
jgi:ABC-2 type transport system ATP-binding protein